MWGSDYPHDEGTYPFSREALRQVFSDWSAADMQQDPHRRTSRSSTTSTCKALQPLAEQFGPTVAELAVPLDKLPENPNEALRRGRRERAGRVAHAAWTSLSRSRGDDVIEQFGNGCELDVTPAALMGLVGSRAVRVRRSGWCSRCAVLVAPTLTRPN